MRGHGPGLGSLLATAAEKQPGESVAKFASLRLAVPRVALDRFKCCRGEDEGILFLITSGEILRILVSLVEQLSKAWLCSFCEFPGFCSVNDTDPEDEARETCDCSREQKFPSSSALSRLELFRGRKA